MFKNLVELAKECPGLQVTITLGEKNGGDCNSLLRFTVTPRFFQSISISS